MLAQAILATVIAYAQPVAPVAAQPQVQQFQAPPPMGELFDPTIPRMPGAPPVRTVRGSDGRLYVISFGTDDPYYPRDWSRIRP